MFTIMFRVDLQLFKCLYWFKPFLLRLFCVSFAYRLLFSLTNNLLIYTCLRSIFAYRFSFHLRFFCVHLNII